MPPGERTTFFSWVTSKPGRIMEGRQSINKEHIAARPPCRILLVFFSVQKPQKNAIDLPVSPSKKRRLLELVELGHNQSKPRKVQPGCLQRRTHPLPRRRLSPRQLHARVRSSSVTITVGGAVGQSPHTWQRCLRIVSLSAPQHTWAVSESINDPDAFPSSHAAGVDPLRPPFTCGFEARSRRRTAVASPIRGGARVTPRGRD